MSSGLVTLYEQTKKIKSILNSRYGRNTGWLIMERLAFLLVGVGVTAAVARYLGPTQLGQLTYARSFVTLFSFLTDLGIGALLVRELIINQGRTNAVLSTGMLLKLFGASMLIIFSNIISFILVEEKMIRYIILVLSLKYLYECFNVLDYYYQAKVRSKYIAIINSTVFILVALLKVFLIYINISLSWFIVVFLVEGFAIAWLFVWFFMSKEKETISLQFDISLAKGLVKEGMLLTISFIATLIIMNFDKIILAQYQDSFAVGIYGVAATFSATWYFIATAVSKSIAPIASSRNSSYSIPVVVILLHSVAIAIVIVIWFFTKDIILLLYGTEYIAAIPILQIHILALPFVFFISVRKKILVMRGEAKMVLCYTGISALFFLPTALLLSSWLGGVGTAASCTLGWVFCALIAPLLFGQLQHMLLFFGGNLLPTGGASRNG
jgi:O-antigen/teichoic acid export membrane protein